MPLAFSSKSHGTIAFGFFNIETDMLLLENLFFFADRFCQAVIELSEKNLPQPNHEVRMDGFRIANPDRIGNLHGAIQGVDLSGFIGATYHKFPFPVDQKGFKQKPYGSRNQPFMNELILHYGEPLAIRILWEHDNALIKIGDFIFDQKTFSKLINYVDMGGYPRWQDETRPDYVQTMMTKINASPSPPSALNS